MPDEEIRYRSRIMSDAMESLMLSGLTQEDAETAVRAIAAEDVPNVSFDFSRD